MPKKKKTQMGGWKTWAAAGIAAVIAAVQGLEAGGIIPPGMGNVATAVLTPLAAALGIVGLGHKLEKKG